MERDAKYFSDRFSQALDRIQKIGSEYAEARALSWQLQEMRKVILAQEIAKQPEDLSMVQKENNARTTEVYINHLNGTQAAIENEGRLKAQYERWYAQYEALRSLCSLEGKKIALQ